MKLLSKTDYMVWRDCPHNAWMKKWKPDIYYALPLSEFDKSLITSGNQVEEKAREFFGDGILIEGRDEESLERTKELLENKRDMLFQACFSDGTLFAAVDNYLYMRLRLQVLLKLKKIMEKMKNQILIPWLILRT